MEYYSPAPSVNSDMTDEELDKYFATYIPLSNLPTPPPAKESHANTTSTPTSSQGQTRPAPEIQGTFFFIAFPCIPPAPDGSCSRDHTGRCVSPAWLGPRHSLLNIIESIHLACCSWRSGRRRYMPRTLTDVSMNSIRTAPGEERAGRAWRCCMRDFGARAVCGRGVGVCGVCAREAECTGERGGGCHCARGAGSRTWLPDRSAALVTALGGQRERGHVQRG